jgi:hypothetical protein
VVVVVIVVVPTIVELLDYHKYLPVRVRRVR